MHETFTEMLAVGGKKNSLGRAGEVIEQVLADQSRLKELYATMLHEDAWVRMRGADAFEKVCRVHPEWISPYIDSLQDELSTSTQPSIQWHLAQIYSQVELNKSQKSRAIKWLKQLLAHTEVDWIVAANCMDTLAYFVRNGDVRNSELLTALKTQQSHKSSAVVKRSLKITGEFSKKHS